MHVWLGVDWHANIVPPNLSVDVHLTPEGIEQAQRLAEQLKNISVAVEVSLLLNDDRWTARFNDGESIEDMKQRVAIFLKNLKNQTYDTTLIVTSEWVIRAAVAIIRNIPTAKAWELDVVQGSCLELEI